MSQLNRDYKTVIEEYEREQPRGQAESGWLLIVVILSVFAFTVFAISRF